MECCGTREEKIKLKICACIGFHGFGECMGSPLQQQVPLTPLWKDQQGLHPLEAQRGHPAVCNAVLTNTLQFHLNFTWHSFPSSFV